MIKEEPKEEKRKKKKVKIEKKVDENEGVIPRVRKGGSIVVGLRKRKRQVPKENKQEVEELVEIVEEF